MKKERNVSRASLKKRLMAATSMLLTASILMVTVSYAWIVLSIAPEVSGITTQIGSNGSLEIALLNTQTRENLESIETVIGSSLAKRDHTANYSWGNLVDLDYEEYGLGNIVLWPSRLNVVESKGGYVVDSGMLSVPTYGYDGRIVDLTDDTVSGIYNGEKFVYQVGTQAYGVRAIGTDDVLSVQNSALAAAKSNINAYKTSANSTASAVLKENGTALLEIVIDRKATYTEEQLGVLKGMIEDLESSVDYIERALRQGMVAIAASKISDKHTFMSTRDYIISEDNSLSDAHTKMTTYYSEGMKETYAGWIEKYEALANRLALAKNKAYELEGGDYVWKDFKGIFDEVMNLDGVYIGEDKANGDINAGAILAGDVSVTLTEGSGVFIEIADFTGDISTFIKYGVDIEITTMTMQNPVYLTGLSNAVKDLTPADSNGDLQELVDLTTTYGYVLDLAFRCNAMSSDLLLQTAPIQRVHGDSDNDRTMGGGSYMQFAISNDLGLEKTLELMDAIRVAFVDDKSNILGIAKLNTSNRVVTGLNVSAQLYLYDYDFNEDGALLMGERQRDDNVITSLMQSTATAVSVMVWLDGDVVDNTMVSATEEAAMSGTLNLQFASSANLVAKDDADLNNITADKNSLWTALEDAMTIKEAGQKTYTDESWSQFIAAFEYANSVYESQGSSENQIYRASANLAIAKSKLAKIGHEALTEKINAIRNKMGQTGELARYVIREIDGSYSAVIEYTENMLEKQKVGEVYSVDYANNLRDEGEGIKTAIYTDESWLNLAAALYQAEATNMNSEATDKAINKALDQLTKAENDLEFGVYFLPYEYEGSIYYFAISDEEDTYGKWYYSDFTRVFSELTILKLDSKAKPTEIAYIDVPKYIIKNTTDNTQGIAASIEFWSGKYSELRDLKVIGAKWYLTGDKLFTETMNSRHETTLKELIAAASLFSSVDTGDATVLLTRFATTPYEVDAKEAQTVIDTLREDLLKAIKEKEEEAKKDEEAGKPSEGEGNEEGSTEEGGSNGEDNDTPVVDEKDVVHTIVINDERYDIVNDLDYPGAVFRMENDKAGITTLNAIVVVENGVVLQLKQDVKIYEKADGISSWKESEEVTKIDLEFKVETPSEDGAETLPDAGSEGETIASKETLKIEFVYNDETATYRENIDKVTVASTNREVATVTYDGNGKYTVTAGTKAGTAEISISVKTLEGNTYTTRITVRTTEVE